MAQLPVRSAARLLVDQLLIHGVDRAACVPGESYLAVLDALRDSGIDLLTCRAEGGAAMMAEAAGKLTGRPGICFVTRGPGATNAMPGLHIARQDSTPLILFVGQVARAMRHREAFQELDYPAVFGSIAKWVVEVEDARRIPELIARAFRVAMQGRPGPVVVALPEDMLDDAVAVADAARVEPAAPAPAPADIARLGELLAGAARPIAIVGGSRWDEGARDALVAFAERHDLPVVASFRRAPLFPADHRCFAGDLGFAPNPTLVQAIRDSDLVLLIGGRLSEVPSQGYTLLDGQPLVHVHVDAGELGRVYQPTLAIEATPGAFLAAVADLPAATGAGAAAANAAWRDWSDRPRAMPGAFAWGEAIVALRDRLPADAILTNGAGNYAAWLHRYYRFRGFGTQLAPTSGSMGYGVPAAIMAKRMRPDRIVVALAGDGDFLMNGQEFATAVHHDIPVVIVVADNGSYGTIRAHQEREFPGRTVATDLTNPDFAAYARAFGGHGETVRETAGFLPAFDRALASGKPAIVHCLVAIEALSPGATLDEVRARATAQP